MVSKIKLLATLLAVISFKKIIFMIFSYHIWHPAYFHTNSTGNSSLASYFPLKFLDFKTPYPLEFPMIFLGMGMDIFWNHTMPTCSLRK